VRAAHAASHTTREGAGGAAAARALAAALTVGTDGRCSPRHQTQFESPLLELIDIL
jgi:hypothetical protein